jgi:hypothetical protein
MTMVEPSAELALRAQPVLPMSPQDARQVMQAYEEMCKAVLGPNDIQDSGDGRQFTKRSGFQKLSAAYGVSTEILSNTTETVTREIDDEQKTILIARAVVRATHPSGRHADGDGACSSNEKRFRKGDQRMEHNLSSTAVTRAVNRAISNLIAFGSVSAEEVDEGAGGTAPQSPPAPSWAQPMNDIGGVAHSITRVLRAAGVEDLAARTSEIGNEIMRLCDGEFPFVAGRLAYVLAAAVETKDQAEVVEAEAEQDQTTTTDEGTE